MTISLISCAPCSGLGRPEKRKVVAAFPAILAPGAARVGQSPGAAAPYGWKRRLKSGGQLALPGQLAPLQPIVFLFLLQDQSMPVTLKPLHSNLKVTKLNFLAGQRLCQPGLGLFSNRSSTIHVSYVWKVW